MDEQDGTRTPVRERQLETTMGAVERFLMGAPKRRGEPTRERIARLMDASDEVRAILVRYMPVRADDSDAVQ